MPWTKDLADLMGADESALKLLIGQLFGYPVMLLHKQFFKHSSSTMQHIYFASTGLATGYWFLGNLFFRLLMTTLLDHTLI